MPTATELHPAGWPSLVLESVGDVPGAKVAGAWVLSVTSVSSQTPADPKDFTAGLDYLRAAFPREDFGPASQLPNRLRLGVVSHLYILWDIVDCSRLSAGDRPQVSLKSALGTVTHERLDYWTSPGHDLDSLKEAGVCPG